MIKLDFIYVYTTVVLSNDGLSITQQYAHKEEGIAESELLTDVASEVNGLDKYEREHVLTQAWGKSGFTLDHLNGSTLYKLNVVVLED